MISVIIPTYNRANTIEMSVKSVLNQTYKDIELIIVDDNSQDETRKIISNIGDRRITYIKNEKNLGACAARNIGIRNASGGFIAFQDSDDRWHSEKLEKQLSFLKSQDCDIVFCSMLRHHNTTAKLYPPYEVFNDKDMYRQILFENRISTQTILGKKSCFLNESFDESMPRFQDWEIALRLSKKYDIKYLDEILVESYMQDNSISINSTSAIEGINKIYDKNKDIIDSDRVLKAIYHKKIANFMLDIGENPYRYYWISFKNNKSFKVLLLYILCRFGLNNIALKAKKHYNMNRQKTRFKENKN